MGPMTQGMSMPYEVRLDSGDQIYPSEDTDVYCTAHLPRFAVGSEVFCHMPEKGYVAGTVTKIWHNVSGLLVPYQVKFEIGNNIYVQEDTDAFICQMRFKRNQTVSCKLGAFGERRGVVAKILAKEDGSIIAYKIDMSEGSGAVVINAYMDTDEFCSHVKIEVG